MTYDSPMDVLRIRYEKSMLEGVRQNSQKQSF